MHNTRFDSDESYAMESDEKDEYLVNCLSKQSKILDSMQKALAKMADVVDEDMRVADVNLASFLKGDVLKSHVVDGLESDYELVLSDTEAVEEPVTTHESREHARSVTPKDLLTS